MQLVRSSEKVKRSRRCTSNFINFAITDNPRVLETFGDTQSTASGVARMVVMPDTGASHNTISPQALRQLELYHVWYQQKPKTIQALKSTNNQELKLKGAAVLPMQIVQTIYIIEDHITPGVMLDFVTGYPTMRHFKWTTGCRKHALVVAGLRYSILTRCDFDTLTVGSGFTFSQQVATSALVSTENQPMTEALVPVYVKANGVVSDCVSLEPDPAHIQKHSAYACSGIMNLEAPKALACLIHARLSH